MTSVSGQFIDFTKDEAQLFASRARVCHYDLYVASGCAPLSARASLHLLLCVAHEIERATEVASEPLLAMIRLTWWREAIEEIVAGQTPRAHELVQPLARLLEWKPELAHLLFRMIEAHSMELEPECFDDDAEWQRYLLGGYGGILALWNTVLAQPQDDALAVAFALVHIMQTAHRASQHQLVRMPPKWFEEVGELYSPQTILNPSTGLRNLAEIVRKNAKKALEEVLPVKMHKAIFIIVASRLKQAEKKPVLMAYPDKTILPISIYIKLLRSAI